MSSLQADNKETVQRFVRDLGHILGQLDELGKAVHGQAVEVLHSQSRLRRIVGRQDAGWNRPTLMSTVALISGGAIVILLVPREPLLDCLRDDRAHSYVRAC